MILEERLWDDQDSSIISSWEHGCARAMYITFQDIMLIVGCCGVAVAVTNDSARDLKTIY